MNLKNLPTFAVTLLLASTSWASSGTEGAAFLNIPVGAGPAAMGSAYTALATDAYAPVWNPAGLGSIHSMQIEGQHLSYLDSIHYEHTSFVFPINKTNGIGVSIQYLGTGDITETAPANGAVLGDFSAHYAAYSLAYGHKMTDRLSLGLTGKIIDAKISDVSAQAYAADLGTLYQPNEQLNLAATLVNMGTKLTFSEQGDSLPFAFRLSGAYRPVRTITMALESQFRGTGKAGFHLGLAWQPLNAITLRAGYKTETTRELSPVAGLTAGIGIHFYGQELAYAWLPYGDLGDTHYFSLVLKFGASSEDGKNLTGARAPEAPATVASTTELNALEELP